MSEVGIVRGDYGKGYQFIVKNVDYSTKTANLFVQSPSGTTMLINGGVCSVSATDNSQNTLVVFVPISGDFGAAASYYKYVCRIRFTSAGFKDSTEVFNWTVSKEAWATA